MQIDRDIGKTAASYARMRLMFLKKSHQCLLFSLVLFVLAASTARADDSPGICLALPSSIANGDASPSNDPQTAEELSSLENKFFSHDFPTDSPQIRLDRIERFVYGSARSGSVHDRMAHILSEVHMSPSSPTPSPAPRYAASTADQREGEVNTAYQQGSGPVAYPPGYPTVANPSGYPVAVSDPSAYPSAAYPQGYPAATYPPSAAYSSENEYAAYSKDNESPSDSASIKGPQKPPSLKAEVSSMEQQVYGRTYTDSLNNRVARLEQTVFSTQPTKHFAPLPTRISSLMAALQPTFSQTHNLYASTPILASSKNSRSTDEEKQKQGHPFLKKLGQDLGRTVMAAGTMAGSMGMSSMMSGGLSNMMGGYGGGYGGMPGSYGGYGGYGGYGMNSGMRW